MSYSGANLRGYRRNFFASFFYEISKNRFLYLLALPGLVYFLLFNYWPLAGIVLAFKDFKANMGMFGSPGVGLANFKFLFSNEYVIRASVNTIYLNLLFITFQQIVAIMTAIFLNEVAFKPFKRISQTLAFLPYFVSWIVVSAFSYNLFNYQYGMINGFLKTIGTEPVLWNERAELWPAILVLFVVWKYAGYLSVVYLAAVTSIDPEYYESTAMEGATKLQQIRYVTLPLITPIITIMLLLSVGRIFFADFGAIYSIIGENSNLFPTTDVIDTYVFRSLRQMGDVGMSSAAGLYQSVVGFVLVLASNWVVKKTKSEGVLF